MRSALVRIVLPLALAPCLAQAQVDTGAIVGTVRDKTGAVVPGAKVGVHETATNTDTAFVADAAGNYVATPLRIGVYAVSVEREGFKRQTRDGIVLRVQDRLRIDFELEPGELTEQVVVTAEAPLVQTETSSLGE